MFRQSAPEKKRRPYRQKYKDVVSDDKFIDRLGVGASRAKAAMPGSPINLGVRSPSLSGPFTWKDPLLRTDKFGPHTGTNNWQNAMFNKRYMKFIHKEEDDSLNAFFDPNEKTDSRDTKMTLEQISKELSDILFLYSAREQGGIEHARKDASTEDLVALVKGGFDEGKKAGRTDWSLIAETTAILANRYMSNGRLGVTDGTIKGEEIAHDVAVEAQQALLKELKDTYGKDKDKSQLIEIERVAKELRSHERFQKYR